MDDSYEPILPDEYEPILPSKSAPADEDDESVKGNRVEPPPLPRLWKTPPEVEDAEASAPKKVEAKAASPARSEPPRKVEKPRPKPKKKVEVLDDGTGAVQLEETPVLDTYEARQRVRWIVSGALGVIALTGTILIFKAFQGGGEEEIRDGEPPVEVRANSTPKASAEREARILLDMAKQADTLGKTAAALDQLNKLNRVYTGTAAAREAAHALDRYKQELSLFGLDGSEMANGPKLPAPGTASATGPSPAGKVMVATGPPANKSATGPTPIASPTQPSTSATSPAPVAPTFAPTPPPTPIVSRPLPSGYRPKYDFPIHPSGWPTRIVSDRDGAEMVLVPASTFLMGRDDGEVQERPTHEVAVSTFYIDLHEVTVRQFLSYLKESGRTLDASKIAPSDRPMPDDLPVVNISARDAKAYCTWMKRRLPTEAQWELAARGPEGRVSYWNGDLPRKDPVKGPRTMEPVMSLATDVSPFGAFDLSANAWEWTSEYYDSKYYQQFRKLVIDPAGPKESPARLAKATVKGGSKAGILTWREGLGVEQKLPFVGFRGALPVEGTPIAPPPSTPALPSGPAGAGGVQPF